MTNFKREIVAVATVLSMVLTASPVFAATTLEISGNGSSSTNTGVVTQTNNTTVVQSSTATVSNDVHSNTTTGGNNANDNTNGDVLVKTGKATSTTTIENTLNANRASVDCCSNKGDTTVTISGNGTRSDNTAAVTQGGDTTQIFQDNVANVRNHVDNDASTGKNDANRNTGGDVTIDTGAATATSNVTTKANVNEATIGGVGTTGTTGHVTAKIIGNGSDTDNSVVLDLTKATSIVQDNLAQVDNRVRAEAKTGYNDANDNTGGEVTVWTGNAKAKSTIENMVNFNSADIDCGCLIDATAKVADNGTNSDNHLTAALGDSRSVFQGGREGAGNRASLDNHVNADAATGSNDTKANSGGVMGSDPFIWSGDATSENGITNTGNVNVYGASTLTDWPQVDFNFNLSLTLSQLAALLGH